MKIIDANIILRYLLKDNLELHQKSIDIIENQQLFLPNEIIAEIVYVLEKVYNISKREIRDVLTQLFEKSNFEFIDKNVIISSLKYYTKFNLDFADSLLLAYSTVQNTSILTFDKRLNKIINRLTH